MTSSRILSLYSPEDAVVEDRRRHLFKYIRGSSRDKAARVLRLKVTDAHLREAARPWRALRRQAAASRARKKKAAAVLKRIRSDRVWVRALLRDLRKDP